VRFSNLYGSRGSKRKGMEPLQWSAVNTDWKVIQLARSKAGRGYPVPLNTVALAALEVLRERAPKDENGKPTGAVIRRPSGLPLYSGRKWFAACLKKAAITDFCWHDLRHTFGTRLRRNRIPLEDIKQLMGHALGADEITLRYAHADIDNLHEAIATLEHRTKTVHSTISEISSKRSA
jgi:integrase